MHDPEQFAALFDRHARQIHLYVARRLGTQAADDIVAETFLAAFRRRESYDVSFALARPWLYGVATTLIARHRRQEERLLRALSRTGVDPLPEALADSVARRVTAEGRERDKVLAALPRGDRDVLLLVAWEGPGDLRFPGHQREERRNGRGGPDRPARRHDRGPGGRASLSGGQAKMGVSGLCM
ncbi:RNA polymerase sigma factor [Nonomuraea sp. NBC_01738]|uniref:RNA polymerase sigma factor n=1 Tax=Nonomuraea sp. NBC_01738 TaxID=2976003 RepID=UPI002E145F47|nr:RNA polymerase sigma factor [Nonomuraea sp. NBC_01738]